MKLNLLQFPQLDLQLLKGNYIFSNTNHVVLSKYSLKKNNSPHFPVLIQEVLANLVLNSNKPQCFLSSMFSSGGDSKHILELSK